MNRLLLLAAGALALGLVIADEVAMSRQPSPPFATAQPPALPTPALPETDRADGTRQAWLHTALARPLFDASRRPPPPGAPAAVAAPVLPRLAGVLVTPSGREVLFAGSDGKPVVLREGGRLAGFTVVSIAAGEVTMQGPGGQQVLRPAFDSARQPGSPAGLAPPPLPAPVQPIPAAGVPHAGNADPGNQ